MTRMTSARAKSLNRDLEIALAMHLDQWRSELRKPIGGSPRARGLVRWMTPPGDETPGALSSRGGFEARIRFPAERAAPREIADASLLKERVEEVVLVENRQRERGSELAGKSGLSAAWKSGEDCEGHAPESAKRPKAREERKGWACAGPMGSAVRPH